MFVLVYQTDKVERPSIVDPVPIQMQMDKEEEYVYDLYYRDTRPIAEISYGDGVDFPFAGVGELFVSVVQH